jgi:hypothetical protein
MLDSFKPARAWLHGVLAICNLNTAYAAPKCLVERPDLNGFFSFSRFEHETSDSQHIAVIRAGGPHSLLTRGVVSARISADTPERELIAGELDLASGRLYES